LRLWVKLAAAVGFINGVARATFGALSPIGWRAFVPFILQNK
jgi:hypothetical protein